MSEKSCFKCGERKPLSEFYKHPQMADGHLGKCKACTRRDTAVRVDRLTRTDLAWIEREAERSREKTKRARLSGWISPVATEAKKAWEKRNKIKKLAQGRVSKAIKSGKLARQPCCICGDPKVEAHHDDYSKPLDVRWLCKKHHDAVHLELNRLRRKERFEKQTNQTTK